MNFFKFYRLLKLIDMSKALIYALFYAAVPWAIALVALPEHLQPHTVTVFIAALVLFSAANIWVFRSENEEMDADMASAEKLFENLSKTSSKNPEERKAAAASLVKQMIELEGGEDDEEEDDLAAEEKQANVAESFKLFSFLQQLCTKNGVAIELDEDDTVQQLAEGYEYGAPSFTEALSILLPDYRADLWVEVEDLEGTHSEVMTDLIEATNKDLGISHVVSLKDESAGTCRVEFIQQGKRKRIEFREPGNTVSENFLRKTTQYLGRLADGEFMFLDAEDSSISYLFLPSAVAMEFKRAREQHRSNEGQS